MFLNTLDNIQKVELLPYHSMGKYKWEKMNKKYAQSTTWSSKVNSYISSIKEK